MFFLLSTPSTILLLLLLLQNHAQANVLYSAPTVRVLNATNPTQATVSWTKPTGQTSEFIEVEASAENNFLPSRTVRAQAQTSLETVHMTMEKSTFKQFYFFRMRPLTNHSQGGPEWSPTNVQWTISSECDDYLHVMETNDPSKWECRTCPEGGKPRRRCGRYPGPLYNLTLSLSFSHQPPANTPPPTTTSKQNFPTNEYPPTKTYHSTKVFFGAGSSKGVWGCGCKNTYPTCTVGNCTRMPRPRNWVTWSTWPGQTWTCLVAITNKDT